MSKKLTIELTDEQFAAYQQASEGITAKGLPMSPEALVKMLAANQTDPTVIAKDFWRIVKKLGSAK